MAWIPLQESFLLYRIRAHRDAEAFRELHARYAESIFRFLCLKMPRREDAEDALSTTFVRFWDAAQRTEIEHVSGFLYTVARSVIADFYRTKRFATTSYEVLHDEGQPHTSIDKQVDEFDQHLTKERVFSQLKRLKDDAQEAIYLRYVEDLPLKTVAERLNKKEGAVRVLIHRALKELSEHFNLSL